MKVEAVVFDLFGTLLDIASLRTLVANLLGKKNADAVVQRWRDKQIAYSFAATLMDRYDDFDTMTARSLDYVLAALDIDADAETRTKLCDGWLELRPYPDATLALEAFRSKGVRTAVLTNGTLATAKRALANSGLDSLLNDVWSVDEVRKFKPAPQVYALACMRFGNNRRRSASFPPMVGTRQALQRLVFRLRGAIAADCRQKQCRPRRPTSSLHCRKSSQFLAIERQTAERWQSGRMHSLGKRADPKGSREFESPPLRQPLLSGESDGWIYHEIY